MPLRSVGYTHLMFEQKRSFGKWIDSQWSTFPKDALAFFPPNARPRKFHFSWQTFLTIHEAICHARRNYSSVITVLWKRRLFDQPWAPSPNIPKMFWWYLCQIPRVMYKHSSTGGRKKPMFKPSPCGSRVHFGKHIFFWNPNTTYDF